MINRTKTGILSIVLALCISLGMFPVTAFAVEQDASTVLLEIVDRRGGSENIIQVTQEIANAATVEGASYTFTKVNLAGTRSLHADVNGPVLTTLFSNLGIVMQPDNQVEFRAFDNFAMTMRWDWLTADRYFFPNQRMIAGVPGWHPGRPSAAMFADRVPVPAIIATQQEGRLMFGQTAPHEQAANLSVRSMFNDPLYPRPGNPGWTRHGQIVLTDGSNFAYETVTSVSPQSGSVVQEGTPITFTSPPFSSLAQGFVYFTTDGSEPTTDSALYNHNINGAGNLLRPEITAADADQDGRVTVMARVFGPGRLPSTIATFYYYIDGAGLGDATASTATLQVTGAVARHGYFSLAYLQASPLVRNATFNHRNAAGTIGTDNVYGIEVADLLTQVMSLHPGAESITVIPDSGPARDFSLDSSPEGVFWTDMDGNRMMLYFDSAARTGLRLAVGQSDTNHVNRHLWVNHVEAVVVNAAEDVRDSLGDATAETAALRIVGAVERHGYFSLAYLQGMSHVEEDVRFFTRNAAGTENDNVRVDGISLETLLTQVMRIAPDAVSITVSSDDGGMARTFYLNDSLAGVFGTDYRGTRMMLSFHEPSRTGLRLAVGQAYALHANNGLWVNHAASITVNVDTSGLLFEIFDRRGGRFERYAVTQDVIAALPVVQHNFTAVNAGGFRQLNENVRGPEVAALFDYLNISMEGQNRLEVIGFDNFGQSMRWDYLMEERFYFPNQRADAGFPWHSGRPPAEMFAPRIPVPAMIAYNHGNGRLFLGHRAPHEACNCLFVFNLHVDPHYPTPGWSRNGRIILWDGDSAAFPTVSTVYPPSGSTVSEGTAISFLYPFYTHHTHGFVHFTTDGSAPTFNDSLYNMSMHGGMVYNPIIRAEDADPVTGRVTVNVRVFGSARLPSTIATFYYYVEETAPEGTALQVTGAVESPRYFSLADLEALTHLVESKTFTRRNQAGPMAPETVRGITLSNLLTQVLVLNPNAESITFHSHNGLEATYYLNDEPMGVFWAGADGNRMMLFFTGDERDTHVLRLAIPQRDADHANLGMWMQQIARIVVNAGAGDIPSIDMASLLAAIAQAETKTEAMYTPESWAEMQTALEAAITVRNNPLATQEHVNTAASNLMAAINALEEAQNEEGTTTEADTSTTTTTEVDTTTTTTTEADTTATTTTSALPNWPSIRRRSVPPAAPPAAPRTTPAPTTDTAPPTPSNQVPTVAQDRGIVSVTLPVNELTGRAEALNVSFTEVIGSGNLFVSGLIRITSGNTPLTSLSVPYTITVDLSEFNLAGMNPNRIVATINGRHVGGTVRNGIFEFNGAIEAGTYQISYVPTLTRATLQLGSTTITDLTGNSRVGEMDVAPVIINDRALVPIRFIAEDILNLSTVGWDHDTRTVTLNDGGRNLSFAIGEMASGMDVPAQIIDDRTMVPIRFVSEFFGATVNFDHNTRVIEIIR